MNIELKKMMDQRNLNSISPTTILGGIKKSEKSDEKKSSSSPSSCSSDKSKSNSNPVVSNSPTVKPPYSYIALSELNLHKC